MRDLPPAGTHGKFGPFAGLQEIAGPNQTDSVDDQCAVVKKPAALALPNRSDTAVVDATPSRSERPVEAQASIGARPTSEIPACPSSTFVTLTRNRGERYSAHVNRRKYWLSPARGGVYRYDTHLEIFPLTA